jgi:hypothetical protein
MSTNSRTDNSVSNTSTEELAYAAKYRGIGQQRARAARSYAAMALGVI